MIKTMEEDDGDGVDVIDNKRITIEVIEGMKMITKGKIDSRSIYILLILT
jgi:hypothetical protein